MSELCGVDVVCLTKTQQKICQMCKPTEAQMRSNAFPSFPRPG